MRRAAPERGAPSSHERVKRIERLSAELVTEIRGLSRTEPARAGCGWARFSSRRSTLFERPLALDRWLEARGSYLPGGSPDARGVVTPSPSILLILFVHSLDEIFD